ncbi:MAG TPA: hypothetical protein VFH83_14540 [Spirochaetia bacterium]|nr:hypothetical protein [Spirochaetia bacterium]
MRLAPLHPDHFLVWVWQNLPPGDRLGTIPLQVDDVAFELREDRETVRRNYVRLAARVRRNQRLGKEPFDGIS